MVKEHIFKRDRVEDELRQRHWKRTDLFNAMKRLRPKLGWPTLSDALNDTREPRADVVFTIAEALEINPAYLWGLTDTPKRSQPLDLPPAFLSLARRFNNLGDSDQEATLDLMDRTLKLVEAQAGTGQAGSNGFDLSADQQNAIEQAIVAGVSTLPADVQKSFFENRVMEVFMEAFRMSRGGVVVSQEATEFSRSASD